MLWARPQGQLPRQDFCLSRICPKKGGESSSAQTYCWFPRQRARWEWSRGERDQEVHSLRLFPTEHLEGLEGGGGRVSSSLPQAGGRGGLGDLLGWGGGLGKCVSERTGVRIPCDFELAEGEGCSGGWAWGQSLRIPNRSQGMSAKPQQRAPPPPASTT